MMRFHKSAVFVLMLSSYVLLPWHSARAQLAEPESLVSIQWQLNPENPAPGEEFRISLFLRLQEGWHINAHAPLDEFLIPTTVKFQQNKDIAITSVHYADPVLAKFSFSDEMLAVYEHETRIEVAAELAGGFAGRRTTLRGTLTYQACNDQACLPPVSKDFAIDIVANEDAAALPQEKNKPQGVTPQVSLGGFPDAETILQAQMLLSLNKAYPGSELKAALRLTIAPGWHINSNAPLDEFLIPTQISFVETPGLQFSEPQFPPALRKKFAFSEDTLLVYEEEIIVGFNIVLDPSLSPADSLLIRGKVQYQACNDVACLAPATFEFSKLLRIAGRDEAIFLQHPEIFKQLTLKAGEAGEQNEIAGLIEQRGLGLALLVIFLGGLALNLTPCVYPLIPITVSYFGGQARGSTAKMFSLALLYVLGIAITYSAIGVFAALSGSLFGSTLQNPVVLVFVAAVMVGLSLSMFGLWEFTVPQWLNQMAGGARQGYLGAFFMGLTVGIVAAPCIGPFVLALLTYVGAQADPVLGFWLFFVLSLGLGLPYLILGTFSGSLQKLPRSGLWMIWVKKIFGFILLGMAAYFLQPILPPVVATYLLPAILFVGGVYAGFLVRLDFPSRAFAAIRTTVGVAFVAIALYLAWPEQETHAGAWNAYSTRAVQEATAAGKPAIIDFTADWCIACKELEKLTFPSEPVLARASKFALLRADLTKFASRPVQAIKDQFNIKGLPTVVFIDANGNERKDLRVIGFVPGDEFARRMDAVLNTSGTN